MFFKTIRGARYYKNRHTEEFRKRLKVVSCHKHNVQEDGSVKVVKGYTVVMR